MSCNKYFIANIGYMFFKALKNQHGISKKLAHKKVTF